MNTVFIDGKEGTTGLKIYERLQNRSDIKIIALSEEDRKNPFRRAECLNSADISFLCLPDGAAREAVGLVKNPEAKIIDASTAHRTADGWVYGFPEISDEKREAIAQSKRVANPGCYATGFISIVAPLIKAGFVSPDYPFVAHGISGYSGAGKKAIAVYENPVRGREYDAPREYAHTLLHKHLPEMVKECGLLYAPVFNPFVCDYYSGMIVTVPLHARLMAKKASVNAVREYFAEYYATRKLIKIEQIGQVPDYLAANELAETDLLKIVISGNDERIFIASVFDNLGKGASGAAVQNMNIMLGLDETAGLVI